MKKSLHTCGIIAKKPEQLEQIACHLRYWPYVKYYCFIDECTIMVGVHLGEARSIKNRRYLYKRTRELITLCLRQYDVELTMWIHIPNGFIPPYSEDLFVRPTSTIRPFSEFISDLDKASSYSKNKRSI